MPSWQSLFSIACKTKTLNIPQITLAKLARSGKYQSGSQELPGSIPTGVNFFDWIYFALPYENLYCQLCISTEKTWMCLEKYGYRKRFVFMFLALTSLLDFWIHHRLRVKTNNARAVWSCWVGVFIHIWTGIVWRHVLKARVRGLGITSNGRCCVSSKIYHIPQHRINQG